MRVEAETLAEKARKLRRLALEAIAAAGSGHPGGSLSAADIVAVLFFQELRWHPTDPLWPLRDRFILSKGHAAPILYAALAEAGRIPSESLKTLRRIGSPLQGHPSVKDLPWVEASTGSLGQGLSIGLGHALAGKMDRLDFRVFVLLGDGELNEGQVWEAAMAASHYGLQNLVAIVDKNGFQLDGPTDAIMGMEPLRAKWEAFGWEVEEVDGHDVAALQRALAVPRPRWEEKGRPRVIIAHTVKGKGVSFMEGNNAFHGRAPTPEELERALNELGGDPR
ncbi:MAG: transketolase [Clostridiales bacterium]|nr:transketolase [Clostridiales bacterium]